jgi:hypothetical protein
LIEDLDLARLDHEEFKVARAALEQLFPGSEPL